jgi:hypothetical protein
VDGTPDASSNEDIVAEPKRLRRENEVLRQERAIIYLRKQICHVRGFETGRRYLYYARYD